MKQGLDAIFDGIKEMYGSAKLPNGREVTTRKAGGLWIEAELGGLNPTSEQLSKAVAIAQQLGAGPFVYRMTHVGRLDFILDEITKHLTVEWIEDASELDDPSAYQRAKQRVYAMIYGGGNGSDQAS